MLSQWISAVTRPWAIALAATWMAIALRRRGSCFGSCFPWFGSHARCPARCPGEFVRCRSTSPRAATAASAAAVCSFAKLEYALAAVSEQGATWNLLAAALLLLLLLVMRGSKVDRCYDNCLYLLVMLGRPIKLFSFPSDLVLLGHIRRPREHPPNTKVQFLRAQISRKTS